MPCADERSDRSLCSCSQCRLTGELDLSIYLLCPSRRTLAGLFQLEISFAAPGTCSKVAFAVVLLTRLSDIALPSVLPESHRDIRLDLSPHTTLTLGIPQTKCSSRI